ncbi:hypothetical protein [Phreatobacter sp. AB_2022a]|uniref:hypothetical protein n=1 Tax=Phreatobacter sp. AB_2022a TaxID=3003134 RepID=UPI002287032A|nr:hypothetical protein [Phreatobacter sp. AB_2022a]MCZ0734986.1 hypothetical protein [Phreatobacter sp. AB_2022a]
MNTDPAHLAATYPFLTHLGPAERLAVFNRARSSLLGALIACAVVLALPLALLALGLIIGPLDRTLIVAVIVALLLGLKSILQHWIWPFVMKRDLAKSGRLPHAQA